MSEQEPAWKRHGRNGPFDWWLQCARHGVKWSTSCMSCGMAVNHNDDLQQRLDADADFEAAMQEKAE